MPDLSPVASTDLAKLTAGDFEARLNNSFILATAGGALAFELVEVRRLGRAHRESGAFSLLFATPRGAFLPQATYPLEHPTMGKLPVFLVPIGPTAAGNGYEAVFT